MGMINFNKPLETKQQGHEVRVLGTLDTQQTSWDKDKQFSIAIAIQLTKGNEIVRRCNMYGEVDVGYPTSAPMLSSLQVVNRKVGVTRWVNIYSNHGTYETCQATYDTEEEARVGAMFGRVDTIKINFKV